MGPQRRSQLLGGAIALLHLITFEEPFGLSVAEAMTAGTAVITHPRGSMPELIQPGVTGFLVSDHGAAVAAVPLAVGLDRLACRTEAIARFSSARMVSDYEELFAKVSRASPSTSS